MLPREDLLKGMENRDVVARVIDRAEQAIKTWEVVSTDFLSPPELAEAQTFPGAAIPRRSGSVCLLLGSICPWIRVRRKW
jgi:hypothetical protein